MIKKNFYCLKILLINNNKFKTKKIICNEDILKNNIKYHLIYIIIKKKKIYAIIYDYFLIKNNFEDVIFYYKNIKFIYKNPILSYKNINLLSRISFFYNIRISYAIYNIGINLIRNQIINNNNYLKKNLYKHYKLDQKKLLFVQNILFDENKYEEKYYKNLFIENRFKVYVFLYKNLFENNNILKILNNSKGSVLIFFPIIMYNIKFLVEKKFNIRKKIIFIDNIYLKTINFKNIKNSIIVTCHEDCLLLNIKDLSLLVINDEHSNIYIKKNKLLSYNLRDLIIIKAREENIPLFIFSKTPSLRMYLKYYREKHLSVFKNNKTDSNIKLIIKNNKYSIKDIICMIFSKNIKNSILILYKNTVYQDKFKNNMCMFCDNTKVFCKYCKNTLIKENYFKYINKYIINYSKFIKSNINVYLIEDISDLYKFYFKQISKKYLIIIKPDFIDIINFNLIEKIYIIDAPSSMYSNNIDRLYNLSKNIKNNIFTINKYFKKNKIYLLSTTGINNKILKLILNTSYKDIIFENILKFRKINRYPPYGIMVYIFNLKMNIYFKQILLSFFKKNKIKFNIINFCKSNKRILINFYSIGYYIRFLRIIDNIKISIKIKIHLL